MTPPTHVGPSRAIREQHPIGITDGLVVDLLCWARGLRSAEQPGTALHHLDQIQASWVRRMAALDVFDLAVHGGHADTARAWWTK